MVFQVFQSNFTILYVEGDKKMVAENLINKYNKNHPQHKIYNFIGEYQSKEKINKEFSGFFIDGYRNESYIKFIKENGLVKLMCDYWNQVIIKELEYKKNEIERYNKLKNPKSFNKKLF